MKVPGERNNNNNKKQKQREALSRLLTCRGQGNSRNRRQLWNDLYSRKKRTNQKEKNLGSSQYISTQPQVIHRYKGNEL